MTGKYLLQGGTLLDGSGAHGYGSDIRVASGIIVEIGRQLIASSEETILSAEGKEVLPGFVDVHSHDDAALLRPEAMTPKLSQGITTTVVGNCGHGCAPSLPGGALEEYSTPILGIFPEDHFSSFIDYLDRLERESLAVGAVALVPHSPIRSYVLGVERRPARPDEIQRICALLDEALSSGAAGLSLGLMYSPGNAAEQEELLRLAKTVAHHDKLLVVHLRNEANNLMQSIGEAISLARGSGCSLHISHLKITGPDNFGTMPRVIEALDRARRDGLDVTADVYPYTAGSTTAASLFPSWATDRGTTSLVETLADPRARGEALAEMRRLWKGPLENYFASLGPRALVLAGFSEGELQRFEGRSLESISKELGRDAADALATLMLQEGGTLTAILFQSDPAGIEEALAWPHTLIGSDGLPRETGYVHPRLYGTFPRVLSRYAGPGKPLSREEAVHRMTASATGRFGLPGGNLAVGQQADLQVIDPLSYGDRANYTNPREVTDGLDLVMLAGEVAWPSAVGPANGAVRRV